MQTKNFYIIGGTIAILVVVFLIGRAATPKKPQQNMPSYQAMQVKNSGNSMQNGVNGILSNQNNSKSQVSAQSINTQLQNATVIYTQPYFIKTQIYETGTLVNIKDILKKVVVSPDHTGGSEIEVDVNYQAANNPVNNAYPSQPMPPGGYINATTGDSESYAYQTPSLFNAEIDAVYIALYKNNIIDPSQVASVTVNSYVQRMNQYGNQQDMQMATTSLSKNDGTQFNWSLDNNSLAQLLNNIWTQRYPGNKYMCNQAMC